MWRRHDELTHELKAAKVAYGEADALRDDNRNPRLEDTLNSRYLQANNRLARASREYNVYIDEVDDIHHVTNSARHQSPRPGMLSADRTRSPVSAEPSSDPVTLQAHTETFQDLERERQELVTSQTISRLSEHIAYIEHLNTALMETLYERQQDVEELQSDLHDAARVLDDYVEQIETATDLVRVNGLLRAEVEVLQDAVHGTWEEVERLIRIVRDFGRVERDLRVECEVSRAEVMELRSRGQGSSRELGMQGVEDGGGDGDGQVDGGVRLEDSTDVMDRRLVDVVGAMSPTVPAHKASAMNEFNGLEWI